MRATGRIKKCNKAIIQRYFFLLFENIIDHNKTIEQKIETRIHRIVTSRAEKKSRKENANHWKFRKHYTHNEHNLLEEFDT